MTIHPITCEQFAASLSDFLEHDITDIARLAMESHARGCTACGALLAEVRAVSAAARSLPELAPSRDLWAGIAARIETPVVDLASAADARVQRSRSRANRQWLPLSAAAGVLIALSAGTTYYITARNQGVAVTPAPVTTRVAASAPAAITPAPVDTLVPGAAASAVTTPANTQTTGAERAARTGATARLASTSAATRPGADEVYGREIARLHAIVAQRRAGLDTATLNVIERNLKVIDDAIAQCRVALARDPASRYLLQSLNSALETKVDLLRTAAQLPAHT